MLMKLVQEPLIMVVASLIVLQVFIVFRKNWRKKRWPILVPFLLLLVLADAVRVVNADKMTELLWLIFFPVLIVVGALFFDKTVEKVFKELMWVMRGALAIIIFSLVVGYIAFTNDYQLPEWFFIPVRIAFNAAEVFVNMGLDFIFPPLLITIVLWAMVRIAHKSKDSKN